MRHWHPLYLNQRLKKYPTGPFSPFNQGSYSTRYISRPFYFKPTEGHILENANITALSSSSVDPDLDFNLCNINQIPLFPQEDMFGDNPDVSDKEAYSNV